MKDTRFIKTIRLRNLLSFGPESEEIELRPLNVLIGPNASGKSNFIDAISLLQAAPKEFNKPIQNGGGINEWVWKGKGESKSSELEITVFPFPSDKTSLRYRISFIKIGYGQLEIDSECIEKEKKTKDEDIFSKFENGEAILKSKDEYINYSIGYYYAGQSILSKLKEPLSYPEITSLGERFEKIKIFNNWDIGPDSSLRIPQKIDLPNDYLLESFNNFALVLNYILPRSETKELIFKKLKLFYDRFDDINTIIQGGTIQVFISEKGLKDPISPIHLSDGTLHYLILLLLLCHPEPPPLICIEEPEIGLHPDIMPTIADLLIEASKRTQLIVTTHSDVLVSALSETPESVLVCEHDEAGTHLRRLEEKKLKVWLEKYSLGELWLKGEIGGTRW